MLFLERDFLLSNLYWIVLVALALLVGAVYLVDFLIVRKRKSLSSDKKKIAPRGDYLLSLGGEANIVSHKLTGSRIVLVLVDQSKIDREALKKTGITGFIEKSDQLTLVAKNAKDVYSLLFWEDVAS